MKKIITVTALAAVVFGLTGCADSGKPNSAAEKLNVVATTTQVQDFVRQIGGDRIAVTGLIKPGASPHSFDPSPADLAALAKADVLVTNGLGIEEFLDSAIEASGFKGKVVAAADGIDTAVAEAETAAAGGDTGHHHDHADHAEHGDEHEHEHGDEHSEHGDEHSEHSDHDHATESEHDHADHDHAGGSAEHGHDHDHDGKINPHIWTSVTFAKQMLEPITATLTEQDPENADFYRANSAAYGKKLETLDTWVKQQFKQVPKEKRKFVSTHNALLYYLTDNEITYAGSVIPSFEDNAEPSITEINQLVQNIREQGVPAVFIESSSSDRLNKTVAKEAGVLVVTSPLYIDSLASSGAASDYIGATISNTETILEAWGYKTTNLPQELQ